MCAIAICRDVEHGSSDLLVYRRIAPINTATAPKRLLGSHSGKSIVRKIVFHEVGAMHGLAVVP